VSDDRAVTALETQIRSQPDEISKFLASSAARDQIRSAAQGMHRAHRIWLVGTGTSLHAAELGAGMIQEAGRTAQAVGSMHFVDWAPPIGPHDAVVAITHTGETAYAASARSQAFLAGLDVITITRSGSGLPHAIETVPKETAETYTVSYTVAMIALAMIAHELGAEAYSDDALSQVGPAVADAIHSPSIDQIVTPQRLLVIAGAGPASVTAREGALKVREASRTPAEGYDAEYLLHGSAVPLDGRDRLVALDPPDGDGLVDAVAVAAQAEGVAVSRLAEPASLPPVLAQIPLTVRLQLLALRIAQEKGQNPDTVIVGAWAEQRLWEIGSPGTSQPQA
jgi:glucosamine--fructose-6-phosphate aminotransferase (isomerizing)